MSTTAASWFAPRAEPALKPNQPNHSSPAPSMTQGQVVRTHGLLAEADPRAEHERQSQGGGAGVDVDGRAAGEVDEVHLVGSASLRAAS